MQQATRNEAWHRIKDAISLVGSVESITGISLLWLKSFVSTGNLAAAVPMVAIASLVLVGVSAFLFVLLRGGYRALAPESIPGKLSYIALASAALIFVFSALVYLLFGLVVALLRDAHFY